MMPNLNTLQNIRKQITMRLPDLFTSSIYPLDFRKTQKNNIHASMYVPELQVTRAETLPLQATL